MPKAPEEEPWQYMGRMVTLAGRILELMHGERAATPHVRHFSHIARQLEVSEEDVRVACNTLAFTHECHVRDTFCFLKSAGEKDDDLAWATGRGRFAQ